MRRNKTFRRLVICFAIGSFFTYGIGQWQPTFFLRSYGIKTGALGEWFAIIFGVAGVLGTYGGGWVATRFARNEEARQLRWMAAVYCIVGLAAVGMYLSRQELLSFALLFVTAVGTTAIGGPLLATVQNVVPDRMRALSVSTMYFFANLIGMGLGPTVTGLLSDRMHSWAGTEGLRYSLLAECPGYTLVGLYLWLAGKSVMRDVDRKGAGDYELQQHTVG